MHIWGWGPEALTTGRTSFAVLATRLGTLGPTGKDHAASWPSDGAEGSHHLQTYLLPACVHVRDPNLKGCQVLLRWQSSVAGVSACVQATA